MDDPTEGWPDLTAVPLAALLRLDVSGDTPLAVSLRRLLAEMETPAERWAAFDSALEREGGPR